MGLVINRPLELSLGNVMEQMELESTNVKLMEIPIYQGGPVQLERGFVLHKPLGNWEATLPVTDAIGITMSRDIIESIANNNPPDRFLVALGYAGWGEGQLEEELAANAWLNGPADPEIIFEEPVQRRWSLSAAYLGVDLSLLSTDIGHA